MTKEQFTRWIQFSMRLAMHGYPGATKERCEKIIKQVADYFRWRVFQKDWPEIMDWDGNGDNYYLGDAVNEFFEEYTHWNKKSDDYTGRFFDQITACIRAGFDVAVEPSAGVVGFTIGDIRRMWKNKVPDWVKSWFETDFDSAKDHEAVWL